MQVAHAPNPEVVVAIHKYLMDQMELRNVSARVYDEQMSQETDRVIAVPVHVEGIKNSTSTDPDYLEYVEVGGHRVYTNGVLDAHDRASLLQEIEDNWNDQEPEPRVQLMLRPSAS